MSGCPLVSFLELMNNLSLAQCVLADGAVSCSPTLFAEVGGRLLFLGLDLSSIYINDPSPNPFALLHFFRFVGLSGARVEEERKRWRRTVGVVAARRGWGYPILRPSTELVEKL